MYRLISLSGIRRNPTRVTSISISFSSRSRDSIAIQINCVTLNLFQSLVQRDYWKFFPREKSIRNISLVNLILLCPRHLSSRGYALFIIYVVLFLFKFFFSFLSRAFSIHPHRLSLILYSLCISLSSDIFIILSADKKCLLQLD